MLRYNIVGVEYPSEEGEFIRYEIMGILLKYLKKDKNGDYLLTKEDYKKVFDTNK